MSRRPPPQHTRFKPGSSGNPGGRPKGTSISAALRLKLDELSSVEVEENGSKRRLTWREAIVKALVERAALKGDTMAAHFVAERADGKVKDTVELVDKREQLRGLPPEELIERFKAVRARLEKGVRVRAAGKDRHGA